MPDDKAFNGRRDFLRKTLAVIPAITVAGYGVATTVASQAAPTLQNPYRPRFFTAAEWAFVNAAVARLIPSDANGPGAVEAGVPEFIDRQLETAYGHGNLWYMQAPFSADAAPEFGHQLKLVPRDIYRIGIAALDRWCQSQHGKVFAELEPAGQDDLLRQLEGGHLDLQDLPSTLLFSQLWQNTREGFFADPIHGGNRGLVGWKLVGFPGARADFMDWVDRNEKYPFPPVSISGERG
ncbi:gluconate 2-dehydrogenase subunit 3 family protein [Azotobacter chroococcum]|uniref:Gluconate 2-dehydrogenase gamma chain n=1 Tax=Azotobacter chroococcum TaxID=353 RepID=A0A4R1NSE1_9GAMM|nr:gluconate 2-dehydrogenase subunit 3 family protein [Azotobacter chroococcum]TBV92823.1 gluconate 2-dehydrogenase subunit 3 family protein [Azotobacter chroococcum]TCL15604.1 gluconate 2-dehydrogenase gamma chain [Azotobacter chroococcum]